MSDLGVIAGTHGFRVTATWITVDDLVPTYVGLELKHTPPGGTGAPYYSGVKSGAPGGYTSYRDLRNNAGFSSVELVEDLTCDVVGVTIERGRSSIGESNRAGTLQMTLLDPEGKNDPRVPPAGVSRTGARILVEVDPELNDEWVPLFTGFVETWGRTVDAGEGVAASQIQATAADGFSLLGRAVAQPPATPVGAGQVGSQRVNTLMDYATWVSKWGPRNITGGYIPMSSTKVAGPILDAIQDVTLVEDGTFIVEPDGTFFWYDAYHRGLRKQGQIIVDITGNATAEMFPQYPDATIVCPMRFIATDDDLDMVNRAVVWRSVETDVGPGVALPEVDKRTSNSELSDVKVSISQHGLLAREYDNLPHADGGYSQTIADRIVFRLSRETNDVGEVELPLVKRAADAHVAARLRLGDEVIVWDDTVGGTAREYHFEYVGVRHDITAVEWNCTLSLDNWVDVSWFRLELLPTGVVSSTPVPDHSGYFLPLGATVPPRLIDIQWRGALGQTTQWPDGHFVWLGDGTRASWRGPVTGWLAGAVNDPTSVTAGQPGSFNPGSAIIPYDFDSLVAMGALAQTLAWSPGYYVYLGDLSTAHWAGPSLKWQRGVVGATATAGTPGTFAPPGLTYSSVEAMNAAHVTPIPVTRWDTGEHMTLTAAPWATWWDGFEWAEGISPGSSTSAEDLWDGGRWQQSFWQEET